MGRHELQEPSQVRHPWRTVGRTGFQLIVGVAAAMPTLVGAAHLPMSAGVVGALAVSAAITRFMAIPAVNDALTLWVPWLAAEPATTAPSGSALGESDDRG
ncbi:hypothetical protein ACIA5H_37560 [Nocardia sp. NPDC051900]|uniref:hypothetical protein n=1 Tax=Nocardia sp. NPDC051900 TaxID=3364326 RepID=UPI0037A7EC4D